MTTGDDSIVDRAQRVRRSLENAGDPATVQAAVGGPCPKCGERVELVLNADSSSFACPACGAEFAVRG